MSDRLSAYAPQALAVLRIVAAVLFFLHGTQKLFGFPATEFMPPAFSIFWFAGVIEIVTSILIALGFFTRPAAFLASGTMAVAFVTNHRKNGFFIFRPGEGWEYVNVLMWCGLALGATGPGQWSLDKALKLEWVAGPTGFAIAAIGGLGGAALLLATCWRPNKK